MISLFDPIQIGELHLPNRIIMAPLTRLAQHHGTFSRLIKSVAEKQGFTIEV
jgi:2,4-dienoyl-CoA reductase-like NADH-dependent reductase (Old Yellow Enzyme family)